MTADTLKKMTRPGSWSLRTEIVVSLALLVAAAVGLVGLVVLKRTQPEMIALKIETGLALARAIEERLCLPQPGHGLERLVRSLTASGFESIVVVDTAGRVLAANPPWPWPNPPSREDLARCMSTRRTLTFLNQPRFLFFGADPTLGLAVPLYDRLRVVGSVGLYSSLARLRAGWARTQWIIFIYLALDTLVAVLFGAYILSRRVVEPLSRMVARVQALAEGEYHPGLEPTEDENEIGRLETSFEAMATRLLDSRARLEENLASLKKAQEGLIRSEKMATVGRLAAGLAHELGNPLGAISGFLHLLRRSELTSEERNDFLSRMESEITRMDDIIRSLLDFARPAPAQPGPVDLNGIVSEALALAEVQKWFQGLEVSADLAEDLPPAWGEANRLTQVLLNLLANAGQSMAGRGTLTVSTGLRGGEAFAAVADTGPGVDPEDLPHLFEPFFTRKEPGQGTGLGLSVSQSIIEALGGRIEVESSPGQGSVFTVLLPFRDQTEES